jgi:anti-sigma B factor antagonist
MKMARRELDGGGVVVGFDEEIALDAATSDALREELTDVGNSYQRVVVDFGNVTFLDSSALGAYVGLLRRLNQKGGALRLAALRPGVRMILEVTRLDRVFTTTATVDEAEASLTSV